MMAAIVQMVKYELKKLITFNNCYKLSFFCGFFFTNDILHNMGFDNSFVLKAQTIMQTNEDLPIYINPIWIKSSVFFSISSNNVHERNVSCRLAHSLQLFLQKSSMIFCKITMPRTTETLVAEAKQTQKPTASNVHGQPPVIHSDCLPISILNKMVESVAFIDRKYFSQDSLREPVLPMAVMTVIQKRGNFIWSLPTNMCVRLTAWCWRLWQPSYKWQPSCQVTAFMSSDSPQISDSLHVKWQPSCLVTAFMSSASLCVKWHPLCQMTAFIISDSPMSSDSLHVKWQPSYQVTAFISKWKPSCQMTVFMSSDSLQLMWQPSCQSDSLHIKW